MTKELNFKYIQGQRYIIETDSDGKEWLRRDLPPEKNFNDMSVLNGIYTTNVDILEKEYHFFLEYFIENNRHFNEIDYLIYLQDVYYPEYKKRLQKEIDKCFNFYSNVDARELKKIKDKSLIKRYECFISDYKDCITIKARLPQIFEFIENKISEIKHKPELKQVPEDAKHIFTDLGYTIFEIASKHYLQNSTSLQINFSILWYYLESKAYGETKKDLIVCKKKKDFEDYLYRFTDEDVNRIVNRGKYYKGYENNEKRINQLNNMISNYIKHYF